MLGVTLHDKQREWVDCLAPNKVGCMGRRFGKTVGEAAAALWFADCHDASSQFVIAPTSDQASVIMGEMERMIQQGSLHVQNRIDKIVRAPFFEIYWKNESAIRSRPAGSDGKNIRSHGADVVRYDEAAFIPAVVIEDVVPPLLATSKYGWQTYISTSWGLNHFHTLFMRGETNEEGFKSFQYPSWTNPHINRRWLEGQKRQMTDMAFSVEYGGEFAETQNALFSHSLVQSCLRDIPERAEPLPGHRYVIGYDPAKYADRSGVVILDITDKPFRCVYIDDISGRDFLVQAPQVVALSERYNGATVLLDSTHDKTLLEHFQQQTPLRQKATGFDFTNASKQELLNGLVLSMERSQLELPHHRDLITELTYYRYELTAAGNVKLGADPKHHDDLVTALALVVQAASVDGEGIPYGWIRHHQTVSAPIQPEEEQMTDEQRAKARIAAYHAAQESR